MSASLKLTLLGFLLCVCAAIAVILWPRQERPLAPAVHAISPAPSASQDFPLSTSDTESVRSASAKADESSNDVASSNLTPDAAPAPTPDPLVPAAFVQPSADDHFTPEQLDVLNNMRKDFADAMQESRLNANDPAYYDRWKALQADFDDRFRSQFGDEAYNEFQNSALHSPPPPQ